MNCLEWLPIYFGILKSGAVAVPMNYRYTAEEIEYCLKLAEADALVFGPEFIGRVETIMDRIPARRPSLLRGRHCPTFAESYSEVVADMLPEPTGRRASPKTTTPPSTSLRAPPASPRPSCTTIAASCRPRSPSSSTTARAATTTSCASPPSTTPAARCTGSAACWPAAKASSCGVPSRSGSSRPSPTRRSPSSGCSSPGSRTSWRRSTAGT